MKDKLLKIQLELKAPKNLYNKFGEFKYRSAEIILETVKPILEKYQCTLVLTDDIVNFGDRYYVKSTAILNDIESDSFITAEAFAREDENIKKMHQSQITGSTSSYARKYALGALFLIDDGKDSDSMNKYEDDKPKKKRNRPEACADEETINKKDLEEILKNAESLTELSETWIMLTLDQQKDADISKWFSLRKEQIKDEMKNG